MTAFLQRHSLLIGLKQERIRFVARDMPATCQTADSIVTAKEIVKKL